MARKILVVLFALFSTWNVAEVNTEEVIKVRLYNLDVQCTKHKMGEMLQKADLEGHGYIKEVTTKVVKGPPSSGTDLQQKTSFYYKIVDCSMIEETEKELNSLMQGSLEDGVKTKLREEIKSSHLDRKGQCKVGMEITFQEIVDEYGIISKRRKRQGVVIHCYNCKIVVSGQSAAPAPTPAPTPAPEPEPDNDYPWDYYDDDTWG